SRRLKAGFQYDPVDSIATTWTPWAVSQSERFNRSPVMVAKVLRFLVTLPAGSTLRTQATTVRLWMSSPAQQACNTSIEGSPQRGPSHGAASRGGVNLLDVLRGHRKRCRWATSSGSRDVSARLTRGLEAPVSFRRKAVRGARAMLT